MTATHIKLEDICEQYEANWTWELSGVQGIGKFLSQATPPRDDAVQLITCLARVDMQNVWALWSQYVMKQFESGVSASDILKHWRHLPKFAGYDELYPSREAYLEQRGELANYESQCRDRWGDAVGPPYFEHHFQIQTQEYMRRSRRLMRCEFEANAEYSQVLFPLRGINAIGRQRTSDADAYFFKPGPEGNRIVIANRFEAEISRNQLAIQLITPEIAVVTNESRVNFIRISGEQILQPTEQMLVAFPFTIQLHGRKLYCY